jgi:uncharacterized iron-regulated protein
MSNRARICLIALFFLLLPRIGLSQENGQDSSCDHHVAQWLDPASGNRLDSEKLLERIQGPRIVLLGEAHTTVAHHRWQHYMLAALHSRNANMMVGFEMLPRRLQSVLDAWSAGELDEEEFLEQSEWSKVWGYDAGLYLPLLHFTRLNRLPALALNVDRKLISQVAQQGWEAIGEEQRLGLSDPAPASDAYRDSLAQLYGYKQTMREQTEGEAEHQAPDIDAIKNSDAFANFVAAQQTWDRAMAEALAAAHRRDPSALVVGIIGRGHLEYGYGIPHQLADLGINDVDVLLPLNADDNCHPLPAKLASAVFVVDADGEQAAPARPRLGILIEDGDHGVYVRQVDGDVILSAAGFDTRTGAELIEIISRQSPGTWLPLKLMRGDRTIKKVAKFPQSFE